MKVLNLYAGIGGNRKLWDGVEVVAVEIDESIAGIYQDFFPDDVVVVGDAHQYLLDHYKDFDFIWSSPPCPTHSITNFFLNAQGIKRYPDMKLWQEIIFLKHFCYCKWVVENVEVYYDAPLPIKPYHIERHYFWSNFYINGKPSKNDFNILNARASTRQFAYKNISDLEELHGFDLSKYNGKVTNLRKILRNCVRPELGKYIFDCAFKVKQEVLSVYNRDTK